MGIKYQKVYNILIISFVSLGLMRSMEQVKALNRSGCMVWSVKGTRTAYTIVHRTTFMDGPAIIMRTLVYSVNKVRDKLQL